MIKPIVYYSVNTRLAFEINEKYYGGIHYVWCCPFFFKSDHPASSTPRMIYNGLIQDIKSRDKHSAKIRENIAGILTGAAIKLEQRIINEKQYEAIERRLNHDWERADFMPLIYVIPSKTKVDALIVEVPEEERAHPDSDEFKIEKLERRYFDVISLHE
jgi:hypothetical protein